MSHSLVFANVNDEIQKLIYRQITIDISIVVVDEVFTLIIESLEHWGEYVFSFGLREEPFLQRGLNLAAPHYCRGIIRGTSNQFKTCLPFVINCKSLLSLLFAHFQMAFAHSQNEGAYVHRSALLEHTPMLSQQAFNFTLIGEFSTILSINGPYLLQF